jgi:hypothetical protein
MSDPVTNLDIEDVLSSIRRLVSEGDRAPAQSTVKREPAMKPVERLVLTPAQRINEAEASDEQEDAEDLSFEAVEADTALAIEASPKAVDLPVHEEGTHLYEDDHDQAGIETVMDAVPTDDAHETPAAQAVQKTAPRTAGHPAFSVLEQDRSRLEATIAELEAAVNSQPEDWEPDGSETKPVVDWNAAKDTGSTFFSRRTVRPEPPEDTAPESGSVDPAPAQPVEDLAPDAAVEVTDAAPKLREPQDGPQTAPLPDQESIVEAAVESTADQLAEAAEALAPMRAGPAEDEVYWDEDALRRLVADVLREELQGELGERITRNVRKLVRREIYRAISSNN